MTAPQPYLPTKNYASQWPTSGLSIALKLLEPGASPRDEILVASPTPQNGPLVSCLMVSRGKLLPARHAIDCFRLQTYPLRELVILDDNPVSELTAFLAELNDPLIRYIQISETQTRLGSLRNYALAEVRGELVCQWDDDDLYDARRLAWQIEALQTSGAQACFLSRWTVWWPEERRIAVSGYRAWEGSMLSWRTAVPAYPNQRRGEDSTVTAQIMEANRVVLMDAPELYCYTIHGGNTFNYQHFLSIYNAASEFVGRQFYDTHLQLLNCRLPIKEYATALKGAGNLAFCQRPKLAAMPDRLIDPALPRQGRKPSGKEPLVSIIVRSMGRDSLSNALTSLAIQSYPRIEVLVVDATGGCHPPLPSTIANDSRFRLVSAGRPLKRPAAANFGLSTATGEYIGFLDDDDLFDPEHLTLLVRRILEPDHPDLVYAGIWLIDRYHRLTRRQCHPFNVLMFLFFNLIPAISVLFHRRVIEIGCRFDESLEIFEDWDFWLQLVPHVRIERVETPSQYYFIEAGTSGTSIGLNADSARGGHYSMRVRQRWEPCSKGLWRDYIALTHELLARFHDGERAGVRPAMRELLKRYPAEPNLEFHLGRTYLAEGRIFSARRLFESAVSHNRSCFEFLISLSRLWESQGSPEDALACLEEARPSISQQLPAIDAEIIRLRRLTTNRQATQTQIRDRTSRNEICPCGSSVRYKHCCGRSVAKPAPIIMNQLLRTECDQLQTAGTEHYCKGELTAATECFVSTNALLSGQPMVQYVLALLAYDQGMLDEAANHADVALAAATDPVIMEFHRKLHYRRRRIVGAQQLRTILHASDHLLTTSDVRLALASAKTIFVLGCCSQLPLNEIDFIGWQGRVCFLSNDAETLPESELAAKQERGNILLIDGVPDILPPLFDSNLSAQILLRVTRNCPAMLLEIAQTSSGKIGLIYPDDITAQQVGLPGLVLRPTLPSSIFKIARKVHGTTFRIGLRGSCEVDGLHPFDAELIRRLLANGLSVSVHGGTPLLRHFPPSALPPELRLLGFDASPDDFLADIDCLVLRRSPMADNEAALGFVAWALAAGCPLICTNNLPGAELIMEGRNGYCIDTDDKDAICERIARLRQDAALAQSIGEQARETAYRYFSSKANGRWTHILNGVED